MRRRRTLAVQSVLLAIPLSLAAIAYATPPAGVAPEVHVSGAQLADGLRANADGVKLQTKGPTDVSVLTLTVDPGGTTGWHSHPGLAIIALAEGTGTLYATDCSSRTFRAGQAFTETGDDAPTLFRNESPDPVVLTVTFLAPRGEAVISDEAAPRTCDLR